MAESLIIKDTKFEVKIDNKYCAYVNKLDDVIVCTQHLCIALDKYKGTVKIVSEIDKNDNYLNCETIGKVKFNIIDDSINLLPLLPLFAKFDEEYSKFINAMKSYAAEQYNA